MVAIAIENESKSENLDLCSVGHNDRDKDDTVKRETGSRNLGLWCYSAQRIVCVD